MTSSEIEQNPAEARAEKRTARSGASPRVTNRMLVVAILGLTILWLAFLVSVLVFGLLAPRGPRTALERSLGVYEAEIENGTDDPVVWADYISALVSGKQYRRAESAIEDALDSTVGGDSLILAQLARLRFETEEYEDAVDAAEAALVASDEEMEIERQSFLERGITSEPDRSAGYRTSLLTRARALAELGRDDEALEAFDAYLEEFPSAADVLVLRAALKVEMGDAEGAEADYRRALEFVPDLTQARDGLDALGVED